MLFSSPSIWTMVHGVALGGGALLGLAAALFHLIATRPSHEPVSSPVAGDAFAILTVLTSALLWGAVLAGTYVIAPLYLEAPAGVMAPRTLLLANPGTVWIHEFAMESKKHAPWIAAMLTTAVAAVSVRDRSKGLGDPPVRSMALVLLAVSFALVAYVSLMGVFVNKAAPVQ